jgi:hypothetical protein
VRELQTSDFSFGRIARSYGFRRILWAWDFLWAAGLAALGTFLYFRSTGNPADHSSVVGDYLVMAAALFGVVIAAFAIGAALLGERYSKMLQEAEASPFNLLRHFVLEGAILVAAIVVAVTFRGFAVSLHQDGGFYEEIAFGLATFLFLWGLFFALELMKLILGVAVTSTTLFGLPTSHPAPMQQPGPQPESDTG